MLTRPKTRWPSTVLSSLVLLVPAVAAAATLVLPHTFVNGTIADADEVNSNFETVVLESDAQDARLVAWAVCSNTAPSRPYQSIDRSWLLWCFVSASIRSESARRLTPMERDGEPGAGLSGPRAGRGRGTGLRRRSCR